MLIYMAKHSFRYRKSIEMRPIKNRVRFLAKFQIESVLLKSLLITCQNLVDTEDLRIFAAAIEGTAICA